MADWPTLLLNIAIGMVTGVAANFVSRSLIPRLMPGDRPEAVPVPALWAVVFVGYVFVMLYLVEQRWLMPFELRFVVVTVSAVVIVVLTIGIRLMGRRPWEELLIVVVLPAVPIVLVDPLFPRGVDLKCPAIVGDDEVVKGLVGGEQWRINLLVHPLKTPDWWVQQVPISDLQRNWEARAVFGGGSGDRFQLLAIAVPEGLLFREGDVIRAEQIPRTAFKSKLCQVEKR